MIRLIFALVAIMALQDAYSQDMAEVNHCLEKAIGWQCPAATKDVRHSALQMKRHMTYDTALVYCKCRVLNNYDNTQDEHCLALSRACEFGDI